MNNKIAKLCLEYLLLVLEMLYNSTTIECYFFCFVCFVVCEESRAESQSLYVMFPLCSSVRFLL